MSTSGGATRAPPVVGAPGRGTRRAVAAAQGAVLLGGEDPCSGEHGRGRDLGARAVRPEDSAGGELEAREPRPGDERTVAVDQRGQGAGHARLRAPANGAGPRLQAAHGAVLGAHEDDPVGRGEDARDARGLPGDLARRRVERAHGAVARGHVEPLAVGGERRLHELADERLPGRREGEDGRAPGRSRPRAGGGEQQKARDGEVSAHVVALYTTDRGPPVWSCGLRGARRRPVARGAGSYNPGLQGGHGPREHSHPRLRLAVHAADRAAAARAVRVLRDPAAPDERSVPRRAPSERHRALRRPRQRPPARCPPLRPEGLLARACPSSASATACS